MQRYDRFRHLCLEDLASPAALMRMHDDHPYADDLMRRIADSQAFSLGSSAVDLVERVASGMDRDGFYRLIAASRLPFPRIWVDYPAGDALIGRVRVAFLADQDESGLRIQCMMFYKDFPSHCGTEMIFRPDGEVEFSDTPLASLLTKLARTSPEAGDAELVRREQDFRALTRSASVVAILSSLLEQPGLLAPAPEERVMPAQRRALERKGAPAPRSGIVRIRLGEIGGKRLTVGAPPEASPSEEIGASEGEGARRAAHWVRGHYFLARNGKLTYRKPHVRGSGEPEVKIRVVTAQPDLP